MYIEAITVSVNYTDYLRQIIKNRNLFDRWVIVTAPEDQETIDFCSKEGLEYVITHRLHENGAPFAKGKAINDGFQVLEKRDWILILDSDILLLEDTRNLIEGTILDKHCIYGIDRFVCGKKNKKNNVNDHSNRYIAGFFQLFHTSSFAPYQEVSKNAGLDDVLFQQQWDSSLRRRLPIQCQHFGDVCTHWYGTSRTDDLPVIFRVFYYIFRKVRIFFVKKYYRVYRSIFLR